MIKPLAIDHIVLRTEHCRELIDFYCDIIGCTLERETSTKIGLTQLRAGNALIDIVDETELITYLQSRDIDCGEFHKRNGAQGMGRSLYINDIDGNTLELRATK